MGCAQSSTQRSASSPTTLPPAPLAPKPAEEPQALSGSFNKMGHKVKNWKNRFFSLEKGIITYYENQKDFDEKKAPKGEVRLVDYSILEVTEGGKNLIHVCFVKPLGPLKSGEKTVEVGKDLKIEIDEAIKGQWIKALHAHNEYRKYVDILYPELMEEYKHNLAEYNLEVEEHKKSSK